MEYTINDIKKEIVPILKEAGVTKSAVFGSFARKETTSESDLDLLVELPKGKSILDLVRLKNALEKKLNRRVDLLTYRSVSPLLKDIIAKDQIPVL